jgi:hypothetical protein
MQSRHQAPMIALEIQASTSEPATATRPKSSSSPAGQRGWSRRAESPQAESRAASP